MRSWASSTSRSRSCKLKLVDKLHNFSLHALTLCGMGAVASLAVNIVTALVMLIADRKHR